MQLRVQRARPLPVFLSGQCLERLEGVFPYLMPSSGHDSHLISVKFEKEKKNYIICTSTHNLMNDLVLSLNSSCPSLFSLIFSLCHLKVLVSFPVSFSLSLQLNACPLSILLAAGRDPRLFVAALEWRLLRLDPKLPEIFEPVPGLAVGGSLVTRTFDILSILLLTLQSASRAFIDSFFPYFIFIIIKCVSDLDLKTLPNFV